jgi:hypothetical protein
VAHGSLATGTPRAAIDAAGHAVLAWSEGHSIALAERAPAATAFARSASVATSAQIAGDPAVAVDGGAVLLAWRAGRPAGSAIVAIQRPRADAPFGAPQTLTAPGVRIPHWVDPDVDLDNGEAIVAWVQGTAHTTANDRAAVAIAPPDGRFGTSVTRAVRPPAHVYELELLAAAPGRPPIVVMTSSRASRLAAATATVRSDGSLAPTRDVPLGGAGGFRPWAAQGRRRAWLAIERFTAPGRGRQQALLLGST